MENASIKSVKSFLEKICPGSMVEVYDRDDYLEFIIDRNATIGFKKSLIDKYEGRISIGMKVFCIKALRKDHPYLLKKEYRGSKMLDQMNAKDQSLLFGSWIFKHLRRLAYPTYDEGNETIEPNDTIISAYEWFLSDLDEIKNEWLIDKQA